LPYMPRKAYSAAKQAAGKCRFGEERSPQRLKAEFITKQLCTA
jgi:hypothetical protein